MSKLRAAAALALLGLAACGGSADGETPPGDAADAAADAPIADGAPAPDAAPEATPDARADADPGPGPWGTRVVSFTPGTGAGFGEDALPGVVLGPPEGAGRCQGSLDALSLGDGGEIVLEMGETIVDGPGADFVVFENPFVIGCGADATHVYAEPGEVSVSDDGAAWHTWPCTATSYPFGSCAGWHPVFASGLASFPLDPAAAGGDPFDLADLGVAEARFVRIRDAGSKRGGAPTVGFDLDAIGVVHGR